LAAFVIHSFTSFPWAVIVFDNAAALASLPLPTLASSLISEWATTFCEHGPSGILLGDSLTATLTQLVPTLEETATAAASAVQTALLCRAAPLDASGATAPLTTTTTNRALLTPWHVPLAPTSSLFAALHATPPRAWQFAFLPTALTARLSALLTRRRSRFASPRISVAKCLQNKLITGLAAVWNAKEYQACLPPRAAASAAPENASKTARFAFARNWVSSVMTSAACRPLGL
jgi:hypothetical protein